MARINSRKLPRFLVIDPLRLMMTNIRELLSGERGGEVAVVPGGVCG